jgi:hypothetical protein
MLSSMMSKHALDCAWGGDKLVTSEKARVAGAIVLVTMCVCGSVRG